MELKSKLSLGYLPTPIEYLDRISSLYGIQIYLKRDDMTGLNFGGNKVRKLEYLLADAKNQGADAIVTVGFPQSNHVRQTISAARALNIDVHVALYKPEPTNYHGNLLVDALMGAHIHWIDKDNLYEEIIKLTGVLRDCRGKVPYYIPIGGSNEIGLLGYVDAAKEIYQQQKQLSIEFDYIVFASSSGGTQAGLIIGKHLWNLKAQILGISIDKNIYRDKSLDKHIKTIIGYAVEKYNLPSELTDIKPEIISNYDSAGYGILTELEKKAIFNMAQNEGILLDPVYTSRGFGALLDMIQREYFSPKAKILFIHTGGTPALFAYSNELYQPPRPGQANKNLLNE